MRFNRFSLIQARLDSRPAPQPPAPSRALCARRSRDGGVLEELGASCPRLSSALCQAFSRRKTTGARAGIGVFAFDRLQGSARAPSPQHPPSARRWRRSRDGGLLRELGLDARRRGDQRTVRKSDGRARARGDRWHAQNMFLSFHFFGVDFGKGIGVGCLTRWTRRTVYLWRRHR